MANKIGKKIIAVTVAGGLVISYLPHRTAYAISNNDITVESAVEENIVNEEIENKDTQDPDKEDDVSKDNEENKIEEGSVSNKVENESLKEETKKNNNTEVDLKEDNKKIYEQIKINSIELEKKEIAPGESVKIYMDIENPENINSILITYSGYAGMYSPQAYLYYNSESGKFEGYLDPVYLQYGESEIGLSLEGITIYNYNETININSWELGNFGINLESLNLCIKKFKPTINSIQSSKNDIYTNIDGERTTKISMDISNPEKISYIDVTYGMDWSQADTQLMYNEETQKFEGHMEFYNEGEYYISSIYIYLNDGSWIHIGEMDFYEYNIDKYQHKINVKTYAPQDIRFDKENISAGETVNISVDASNHPKNITSGRMRFYHRGSYEGKSTTDEKNSKSYYEKEIELTYNENTNMLEGKFEVGKFTQDGYWYAENLELIDNKYNSYYCNGISGTIQVNNNINELLYPIELSVDTKNAKPGQEVKVTVDGIDKDIQDACVYYEPLNSESQVVVNLNYNKKTKKHEGYLKITPYMTSGIWAISGLYLNAGDTQITVFNKGLYPNEKYTLDFKACDVKVEGTIKDTEAPKLKGISVDKDKVKPGDKLTISLDIEEDKSGVNLNTIYFECGSENSNQLANIKFKYNKTTKKYEAVIDIDGSMLNGIYKVSEITLADNAGNWMHTNIWDQFKLNSFKFEVVDSIDKYTDAIKNVEISEIQPQVGDNVHISVELANSANIGELALNYNFNDNMEYVTLRYNQSNNRYEGTLNIKDTMEQGFATLDAIDIYSTNGYWITTIHNEYEPTVDKFKDFELEVISKESEDLSIDEINIDKNKVTKNQSVNISAKASDIDGDIRKITVNYRTPDDNTYKLKLENVDGTFKGKIDISEFTTPGTWKIENILLEDNERNRKVVHNTDIIDGDGIDLSKCNFEVYGTTLDNTAPELISVDVDNNKVVYGDKVTVSISSKDIGSGIKNVKASFAPLTEWGGPVENMFEFTYNEKTDTYDCTIDTSVNLPDLVEWTFEHGFGLYEIIIEDNSGNIYREDIWSNHRIKDAYFYVSETENWHINEVTDKSTSVSGVTERYATVEVKIGEEAYTGEADIYGRFNIEIPQQEGLTTINVSVKNTTGTEIENHNITVKDYEAPNEPIVTTIVTDKTTTLEGQAEPNSTVVILKEVYTFGKVSIVELAKGNADPNGNFTIDIPKQDGGTKLGIIAIDKSGNESIPYEITVKDTTAPGEPIVENEITEETTLIEGTSEYGSEILVLVNGKVIAKDNVFKNNKFKINIEVQKAGTKLTIISRDSYGNTSESLEITVKAKKEAPVIEIIKDTFEINEKFDAKAIVKATDKEDGDLTVHVLVVEDTVDTSKEGKYRVTYRVLDSDNNLVDKTFNIIVGNPINEAPVINVDDIVITKGTEFKPLEYVTATDKEDGDLTNHVIVTENTVKTDTEGKYRVSYAVLDSDGKRTDKTINVYVSKDGKKTNEKPVINAKDLVIKARKEFDPLEGVTAIDREDGDLTHYLLVTENTVDTSKAGIYRVSYAILDTDGNRTDVSINVVVEI